MRVRMFYHSLLSDWNHGNAHFLRGMARELQLHGHQVEVYEPRNCWSLENLLRLEGRVAIHGFRSAYPDLESRPYDLESLDLDEALDGADLVLAHEWNDPELLRRLGRHRRTARYRLLFHDTHHRAVTTPGFLGSIGLDQFDGALVYGASLAACYERRGFSDRVWVWHEAADVRLFRPLARERTRGDLVWIGNWGDGERNGELEEFLLRPVEDLGLRAVAYGVRYPDQVQERLRARGVRYVGWLPNYRVPATFSQFPLTVHVPRGPYRTLLPGIPTIRVFEALACGIPLVCSPWEDAEGLFRPGEDFLVARNTFEMSAALRWLLNDAEARAALARNGLAAILARHTCAHRLDQLLAIVEELGVPTRAEIGCLSVAEGSARSAERHG